METSPRDLPEKELVKQYTEKRAAIPNILDSVRRTVEVDGHQYDIEALSVNPYPLHYIATEAWECSPDAFREAQYQQIYGMQANPQNYVGLMSQYKEEAGKTFIRMYGATLPNHGFLAGSMYDAGIPIEEITASNNSGLAVSFTDDDSENAFMRYKFDMDTANNSEFYHVWVLRPQRKGKPEVLELRNKLIQVSRALKQVMPEMATRILKDKPPTQILRTMVLGDMLREHKLELNEYTSQE